ncbi:DUF3558 family protein [Amycolatopsis sp. NPDC051758]|uniref:DUF3558 family protein n=1 Tax=Amycolatopsis sp. NPDC051758 TaxID=3363935 RepID=UPI00379B69F1
MTGTVRKALALAALCTLGAGCGTDDAPAPTTSSASTTPPVTPTTSAVVFPVTLAALAEHPCRALDEKQLAELLVLDGQSQEGGEEQTGFRQCQWTAAQGALLFGPHPALDMTADPRVADLEPGTLAGHRTLLGVDTTRDRCMMYVAVAEGKSSFQVAIHPQGQNLGMLGCDIIKRLATTVLGNLA